MAKIGQFVWAEVPFREDDGRKKRRPVLVLGKVRANNGDVVYLGAAKYSAIEKCRGEIEVVLSKLEAEQAGLDKEGVVRFSRDSLVAFFDRDIVSERGHYTKCSPLIQKALENAARSVRFPLK
jgi:hypothetical protein